MKRVDISDTTAVKNLQSGECVLLCGVIYTARDAAHKKMFNALKNGDELPFELKNSVIYYVGGIFSKDGKALSAGPTTSMRMDAYAPCLYDNGLLASIGKGDRSDEVYSAIKKNGGVYFAAVGGAGALYAAAVQNAEVVAYPELLSESVYKLTVSDFPAIVAIDAKGNSIFG